MIEVIYVQCNLYTIICKSTMKDPSFKTDDDKSCMNDIQNHINRESFILIDIKHFGEVQQEKISSIYAMTFLMPDYATFW